MKVWVEFISELWSKKYGSAEATNDKYGEKLYELNQVER